MAEGHRSGGNWSLPVPHTKGQFLAVPTLTGLSYGTQSRQQAHRMVQVQVRVKFGDQVVALVQF